MDRSRAFADMLLESAFLPHLTIFLIIALLFLLSTEISKEIFLSLTSDYGSSVWRVSVCEKESMRFSSFSEENQTAYGDSFSCDLIRYLDDWKISSKFSYTLRPIEEPDVVFVTYSSSNHFAEARQGIRSWKAAFKNKIIFYDLGLTKDEIAELDNVCDLEVRKFSFDRYPNFVSNLTGYHFKAIIMAEVFSEFNSYWIVDTSVRFFNLTTNLNKFYANVTKDVIEPFAMRKPAILSIYAATHPSMYKYLPIDEASSRELVQLAAGLTFIARCELSREAVKWNVLCALTPECMAPSGAQGLCIYGEDRYNTYANCHRFDQSSINIVMASLLKRDGWKSRDRLRTNSMENFTEVQRKNAQDQMKLMIPCE